MVNMIGYFLGHYPQRFELDDHQRTLILQTMLFFIWLAMGAAVFSRVENMDSAGGQPTWAFVDGVSKTLYLVNIRANVWTALLLRWYKHSAHLVDLANNF
jgi:hypothetical protein